MVAAGQCITSTSTEAEKKGGPTEKWVKRLGLGISFQMVCRRVIYWEKLQGSWEFMDVSLERGAVGWAGSTRESNWGMSCFEGDGRS